MKIVIADPSLSDIRGHHYAVTRAISLGAIEVGDVFWLVNRQYEAATDVPGVKIRAVFEEDLYSNFSIVPPKKAKSLPRRILTSLVPLRMKLAIVRLLAFRKKASLGSAPNKRRAAEILIDAIRELGLSSSDHVLIHTADGDVYRMVLDLVLADDNFEYGPRYHVCTPFDEEVMPRDSVGYSVKQVVHYFSVLGVLNRKVFLYAENELLAEDLAERWRVPVEPLELPCVVEGETAVGIREGRAHVAYLGAAREEKGFHELPSIVEQLKREEVDVRVTIQCSPQKIGYTPLMQQSVEKLRALKWRNLELIEKPMSMEEYYRVLSDCDAVILYYDQKRYRVRGSGIAVEAVMFDNVIVATPGTYPAHVGGDAALLARDAMEVVTAVKELVANRTVHLQSARHVGTRYRQAHRPTAYMERLLSPRLDERRSEVKDDAAPERPAGTGDLKASLAGKATVGRGIALKRLL